MKTLISVIKDIPKDLRRSTSLFLVIILGIAAAFGTHLIAYGIVEDIAKENLHLYPDNSRNADKNQSGYSGLGGDSVKYRYKIIIRCEKDSTYH